jgi:AhpC/TSA family
VAGFSRAAEFALIATASLGGLAGAHAQGLDQVAIGAAAPAFSALGADGRHHTLSDYAGKLVVLEWTSPVCPFTALKYKSDSMQALQRYAASQQIVWLSVNTAAADRSGYLTPAMARARVVQTHAKITAFLFDRDGSIGRKYGAKTTPSFFIIDRRGTLAYQGAMDADALDANGRAHDYVRSALDDLLAGQPVKVPQTQPQGCGIEY